MKTFSKQNDPEIIGKTETIPQIHILKQTIYEQ